MLFFLSCRTTEVKQNNEIIQEVEPIELSLDEKIDKLVTKYINEPDILLEKLHEIIPIDNVDYNFLIANIYLNLQKYALAKEKILELPDLNSNIEYLKTYGITQMALSENYLPTLEKILQLDNSNQFATVAKVQYLLRIKKLNDAEEILKSYYKKKKSDDKILILFGDLYLAKVEALNLGSKKVLSSSEESLVTSYYKIALEFYLSVQNEKNSNYYSKLSSIYKKLGRNLDAIKTLDKAIIMDPKDKWNYFDRGKLFFYMNSNEKALQDFIKSYQLDNNHFFTNVFLGRIYFAENRVDKALFHYSLALNINSNYYPAYKEMAVLSYLNGEKEKALNYLLSLYNSRTDKDPLLSLYVVTSLIELGKVEDAKKILQNLAKYEKNVTMKGIYNYFLNPSHTGDKVLNDALNTEDHYQRIRLTYYVSFALENDNVFNLSKTLLKEVADSNISYESKLAKYKLGEIDE